MSICDVCTRTYGMYEWSLSYAEDSIPWPRRKKSPDREGGTLIFPIRATYPYTNTNKEKFGSFFSRALAYEVNGFPR